MRKFFTLLISSVCALLAINIIFSFFDFYRLGLREKSKQVYKSYTWYEEYTYHPFISYYKYNEIEKYRDPSKFKIALIGGSFADQLYPLLESKYKERLANVFGKKSEQTQFFNFAAGGYAQPIQWILLSLYARDIDVVISVEGYNELFLDTYTCLPRDWATMSLRYGPANMQSVYSITGRLLKDIYLTLFKAEQKIFILGSALRPILFSVAAWVEPVTEKMGFLHTQNVADKICHKESPKPDDLYKQRLEQWFLHLNLMKQLPQMNSKKMYLFFQPNLHYRISKSLTDEESKLSVLDARSEDINKWYEIARKHFATLDKQNFIDLTMVYKDSNSTLYSDSCCHVNKDGRELAILKIIDELELRNSDKNK